MVQTTTLPATDQGKSETGTYDVSDVAALLQASERHVWRLLDAGRLPPCMRLGRLVRWPRKTIDEWISSGCPVPNTTGRR